MPDQVGTSQVIRFATFEVDVQAGELRKGGLKLKLSGQPFQVLAILLERPGGVFTREELQKRLWPDTFVDVDHNLNTAINKIREVLGDSAESPRFVETLPRRGYRFIAPLDSDGNGAKAASITTTDTAAPRRWQILGGAALLFGALTLLAGSGFLVYKRRHAPASPKQRTLTRVTFNDGLQTGATWSPDGRFLAYSSDRGGKFDIWVQQVSGGDPVKITKGPANNWQPDWSPDGKYIAYRSEDGEGGLFVVPALGGAGLERKFASFGYYPRWSPDSTQILFRASLTWTVSDITYVVKVDDGEPRRLLADFGAKRSIYPMSASWHPDGKRISVWAWEHSGPSFWTLPATGGIAVQSEIAPEAAKQLGEASVGSGVEPTIDLNSSWAPSGTAIYFERTFRGARNLWKMTIDPNTLRASTIERLTTGPGYDTRLAVSPDGRKLAYTGATRHIRAWLFPFDATRGHVTGVGQPVTSTGMEAWQGDLSRDGKKLAFSNVRGGKWEVWEKSLPDGQESPVLADDYKRSFPRWSPDGTRLTYMRYDKSTLGQGESHPMIWSSQTHIEEGLGPTNQGVFDWSADGKWLLACRKSSATHLHEIWVMPAVAVASGAEPRPQKIISHPTYDLFQSHFSPDGRWIVFEAARESPKVESTLYVIPAMGGAWIPVTDGRHWDDKPRWSPDGKTIYFISSRRGVYNVWGIRFDSTNGKPVGDAFPVTAFGSPDLVMPDVITLEELSLTQDKLVLTMEDRSGSIWVLDNVDR